MMKTFPISAETLFRLNRVAVLAASLATLTLLAGCGGGDNNDSDLFGTGGGTSQPAVSRYAGTYKSTVALPNGATGTTNIIVAANGTCTGTLTVAGGTTGRQATAFSFGAGTYAISGTVDPTTGAFTMTGNIGGQPFSYNGTLPAPGNNFVGGSYSLSAGGQAYTGSFAGSSVTPTPTPAPTSSPTASPSPVAPPSGTPLSITFSAVDGVQNVDTSAFTAANQTLLQAYPYGTPGSVFESLTVIANTTVAGSTDPNRSRRFAVQFSGTSVAPPVGTKFTLGGAEKCGVQFYQFEEGDSAGLSPAGRLYNATGGTVTVLARSASSITLRVSNVVLTPGNYIKGLPTTGAFVADGEITAPIK